MGLSPSQGTAGIQLKSTKFKPMSSSTENPWNIRTPYKGQLFLPLGFSYPLNHYRYFPFLFIPSLI